MNINKEEHFYKTSSLPIACVLSLLFTLRSIDRSNPKRALFVFDLSPELELTLTSYWEGSLKVEPQVFFNQLKVLKSRLYGE